MFVGIFRKIVWEDKQRKKYKMEEITDEHLLNIIECIKYKGGWKNIQIPEL